MIHPLFEKILTPFILPAQKTAEQVQEIPKDTNIYVLSYSDTKSLGWFITELHYKWWEDKILVFPKEWATWDFSNWVNVAYPYSKVPNFWEWWHDRPKPMQDVIVSDFIRSHEPMIRKEMDEYYEKQLKRTSC